MDFIEEIERLNKEVERLKAELKDSHAREEVTANMYAILLEAYTAVRKQRDAALKVLNPGPKV